MAGQSWMEWKTVHIRSGVVDFSESRHCKIIHILSLSTLFQRHSILSKSPSHWIAGDPGWKHDHYSDISPSLHTVLLRVLETKPRKTELSVTKSDDGHWAAYITELVNLRNLKPLEFRKATNSGRVTRITLHQLEPCTPYKVRVRPVENYKEPPIWIDEATFNTLGEHTAAILFVCSFVCLFFSRDYSALLPLQRFPTNRRFTADLSPR